MTDANQAVSVIEAAKPALPNDMRLWGVLGVSVLGLLFNYLNYRHTNAQTKKVRALGIRLDEFRSEVKDPVYHALEVCTDLGRTSEAISVSGTNLAEVKEELEELNKAWIEALDVLEAKLDDANRSQFASGANWQDGFTSSQDKIYGKMDCANNVVQSDANRRKALIEAKAEFEILRKKVRASVEAEISRLAEA
ncbi:hypothetical protein [Aliiroseovarius sp. F47248L]|uniref:hypothetical protein n=1 Tax=Aliiroseovarius sp. F47248L TaxID=2926420 RepID=UPI001FF6CBEF|nr:hypothetical protein [Aliiroseovarius sp. F47248L]MCK0139307.1 hypothetical protein [Aliiroseovarius sp. F47248L]